MIHVVPARTRLDVNRSIPKAAVPIEAGTSLAWDDAI